MPETTIAEVSADSTGAPVCEVKCLYPAGAKAGAGDFVYDDDSDDGVATASPATVVLAHASEDRASQLLSAGVGKVLLGEAALLDSEAVTRLAARFGDDRVGVYVPARRVVVAWSFETVSNADFKTLAPSLCEPAWEIVRADGRRTGTRVDWWLGEMFRRGATLALVRADIRDDSDLNICAGLVENFGSRLWLGPLGDTQPMLSDWVAYGRLTQVVLPAALYARRAEFLPGYVDFADAAPARNGCA